MTVATSLQQQKQSVESDSIRVISGANARRVAYLAYVTCLAASAIILYLFSSSAVIIAFIMIQVLLLASLYPLVKFVLKTEEHDIVWDQDGWHWFRQSDVTASEYDERPHRSDMPPPPPHFLSYAFM
ncbi:unnamed protein product [Nippostrongylus brasiliensis]|uniref:Transmembrane protein n=1 Tax=Nippostrongylus brasiliensis TaxID=27835 RepID=A0A0N4XDL2_NIPBR|nr:hypothetical protein Q1695_007991 [Nippostrongylus brasiliensis]VDL63412.1 unnamed protein product [Nippostrongylus brasiliensis]